MTVYELINLDLPQQPKYESGIDFLDNAFMGGFELGQLVTITGEQEAGKTMLLEQILGNITKQHKALYFSLEFNKRQAKKVFFNRLKRKSVEENALKNIEIVTTDMIDGNLFEIIKHTKDAIKRGVRFIGLDSTLMLFVEGMSGEQEVTEIFRQLQKVTVQNDVLFFIITQGSKEDNRDGKVSIFGSQKANHFTNIMLHLTFEREKNKRGIIVAKNKQEGKYLNQEIFFESESLVFSSQKTPQQSKVTIEKSRYSEEISEVKDTFTSEIADQDEWGEDEKQDW